MTKFKKLAALVLALCMTAGFGVACVDETESSTPPESSAQTEITLTVEVVTEFDEKVEGVSFEIKKTTARRPKELTTNAEGKATFTGEAGEYQLTNIGGIPINFGNDDWINQTQTLTLSESTTLTLVLYDTSPDGSKERPFAFVIDSDSDMKGMQATVPANTTYHFVHYRSVGQSLLIENEHVEITHEGITYKPMNGILSIPLNLGNGHDMTSFTLTNTSNSEITINMQLTNTSDTLGSLEKPIDLTLGSTTAYVKDENAVYYRWTATAAGTLTVTCDDATAELVLENNTQSVVSNDLTLKVNEKDVIYIIVSADVEEGNSASIVFNATFA